MGEVQSIDAGGLGLLLDLHTRTLSTGIALKLVNITRRVQHVLALTNLDRVLKTSSVTENCVSNASRHFGVVNMVRALPHRM
jgi:anti-anti-sigma factor